MEACHSLGLTVITGANFNQCYPGLPPTQPVPVTSWNQCCLAHEPCCYCQFRVSGRTNRTIGFVDEGPLWRIRHTSPHCDGLGIAGVHGSHFLIVAPVPKQEQMMSHRYCTSMNAGVNRSNWQQMVFYACISYLNATCQNVLAAAAST